MLRLELLNVKADLERELGTWSLSCKSCGRNVYRRSSSFFSIGAGPQFEGEPPQGWP